MRIDRFGIAKGDKGFRQHLQIGNLLRIGSFRGTEEEGEKDRIPPDIENLVPRSDVDPDKQNEAIVDQKGKKPAKGLRTLSRFAQTLHRREVPRGFRRSDPVPEVLPMCSRAQEEEETGLPATP